MSKFTHREQFSDTDRGLVETVEHAIRCHERSRALAAKAKEAMLVAADLAPDACYDALVLAVAKARHADVGGRGPLTRELDQREDEGIVGEGVIVRHRGTRARWPRPGVPVVYGLYDEHEALIYVGKTTNTAGRISAHGAKPWRVVRIVVCPDEATALRLEGDLIFQHQPSLNVVDRRERRFVP